MDILKSFINNYTVCLALFELVYAVSYILPDFFTWLDLIRKVK